MGVAKTTRGQAKVVKVTTARTKPNGPARTVREASVITKLRADLDDACAAVMAREGILARVQEALRPAPVSWDHQDVVAGARAVVAALATTMQALGRHRPDADPPNAGRRALDIMEERNAALAREASEARQLLEEAHGRREGLEGEVQALRQAVTTAQAQLEALRAEASALWSDRDRLRQSYAAVVADLQAAQRAAWARQDVVQAS